MAAPDWFVDRLGWKPATVKSSARCLELFGVAQAPNLADVGSTESLSLAGHIYGQLNVVSSSNVTFSDESTSDGTALEAGIENDIRRSLETLAPEREWEISRTRNVTDFAQFAHLGGLQELFKKDATLRATIGRDYQVKTDIWVGVKARSDIGTTQLLHAAISSKWTIRSDRVQNVRHEFTTLLRNRRGRAPHLVLVTAEPLPSRLISITRGTGEVDAVYHVLYDELALSVADSASRAQKEHWDEMIGQRRLRPYAELAGILTTS